RLIITGDRYSIAIGPQGEQGTVKIDATKTPKWFDTTATAGPDTGTTQPGIYELEGDALKICTGMPGTNTRPTEFSAKAGSKCQLIVLKRDATVVPGAQATGPAPAGWKE